MKIINMNEQTLNIKLVKEVQKRPYLYNFKLPEYSQKRVLKKGWSEVGKAVNLTESHAKEKWKNLRTVFARHLKITLSGNKKKSYYLADAMRFTIPFMKGVKQETFEDLPKTTLKESLPSIPDIEDDFLQNPLSSIESFQLSPSNSPSPIPSPPSQHRKPRTFFPEADHNFLEYQLNKKEASINAREMFLLSLLPELEVLDQLQMNIFKRRVLSLIDDIVYSSQVRNSLHASPQDPS